MASSLVNQVIRFFKTFFSDCSLFKFNWEENREKVCLPPLNQKTTISFISQKGKKKHKSSNQISKLKNQIHQFKISSSKKIVFWNYLISSNKVPYKRRTIVFFFGTKILSNSNKTWKKEVIIFNDRCLEILEQTNK